MAKRKRFSETERILMARRAQNSCEYCKVFVPDTFEIEHIIPLVQEGSNDLDNLAVSCGGCNNRKGAKTSAIDPLTRLEVPLFHPRQDIWREHFLWNSDFTQITGISPVGRATVELLQLNRAGLILLREVLFGNGNFPPS
jgi:5-methylcytosine-specific restriction endonuclease McrA